MLHFPSYLVLGHGVAFVVAAIGLTSCNVFDPRSDALSCIAAADCDAPRSCVSGYCVLANVDVPDADLADADPNAPDAGPCKLISLVDDFEDNVAAPLWLKNDNATVTVVEAGGVLTKTNDVLPAGPSTVGYSSASRNYDMTDGTFAIEVPTMVDLASKANANLVIGTGGTTQIEFRQKTGSLSITLFDGGTTVLATLTYSAVNHRWWRMVGAGGTVIAETSPDGVTWTTQGTTPTPSFFNSVGVDLQMRAFSTGTVPGSLVFDNANMAANCSF
jgi:hypothetical protein